MHETCPEQAVRREADTSLPTHAARYRALFDHAPLGIIITDSRSYCTDANPAFCAMLGYSRAELVGAHASFYLVASEIAHIDSAIDEINNLPCHHREWQFRRKDGSAFFADVIASLLPDGSLMGMIRDLTDRKRADDMSRLYDAFGQINQAIVRATARAELFHKVCRVLVDTGGFDMAWIGWHDADTQQIVPVAITGDPHDYIHSIKIFGDDRPEGRGPTGLAFRTGRLCICNDMQNDPITILWRPELQRRGFQASAAFPIRRNQAVCATLTVYAKAPWFFQDKEVTLLQEAATAISFALDNFAHEEVRRQAEQTLRDEKRFSDTMIESMPGIIYFYDSTGHFLRWNNNLETVSGYSGAEMARLQPRDFFTSADQPRVEQQIAEVFATGESTVEAPFLSKHGTLTPYFFTGRRVQYGGATCLVGMGVDISARRQAEERLAESEQKYRELVEHANSIILRWNAAGNVTFLNEFGQRFFGYSAEEIVGRSVMGTIVPATESGGRDLRPMIEDICANPAAFEQNVNENMRRNGEHVWIAWTNRIVRDPAGRVVEILSIGSDITERKRAEAEREKRLRAEAADRIKSAFLANMSHELRTPLNSIIGFTGIILQRLAGPLTAEQSKQLEMVRTSARHLLALVNDVLDISKIEAGQFDVARQPFDLERSLAKVIGIVRPQAEAKQLGLHVQIAPGLGTARSDERRFEQILLNLLSNAIKFTVQGEVSLTADLVAAHPSATESGAQRALRVQVSDTGIGIRAEDFSALFQPFRQIDSGLSRKHDGTGLGLAICRRLAALMGGEIRCRSELGKGSTFTVTLPLHAEVAT